MNKERIRRVLLIAVLLIATIISLLSMNKAIHKKQIDNEEKFKYGEVIYEDDQYKLQYYTDNINISIKKFPSSIKREFKCSSKNCGIIKNGGIYAVIYDNFKYYIYNTKTEKILYVTDKMRDVEFSNLYNINGKLVNNYFIVYKDINNRTCLYNLKKKKITINGNYKEIYSNYTEEFQPNIYYVVTQNKDETYSVINYNTGHVALSYNQMYCAYDKYCVIDNNYVYNFYDESYIVKPNTYKHIYMAIKNAIAVEFGNDVIVIDDTGKKLTTLFNLNDYKDYKIKSYFTSDNDNVMYMVFSFIKNDNEEYNISYNLKTLEIKKMRTN